MKAKSTILIIEDSFDVLSYLTILLEDEYQIITARNGMEGIKKAMEKKPNLVISDLKMPIKNGYEVCQALKSDRRTSHIPIILLSGKEEEDALKSGLNKGADAYLSKPFKSNQLMACIKRFRL